MQAVHSCKCWFYLLIYIGFKTGSGNIDKKKCTLLQSYSVVIICLNLWGLSYLEQPQIHVSISSLCYSVNIEFSPSKTIGIGRFRILGGGGGGWGGGGGKV